VPPILLLPPLAAYVMQLAKRWRQAGQRVVMAAG